MEFTEDDVLQILKLIEQSEFDELHLEMGDLKLSVRKKGGATESPVPVARAPEAPPADTRPPPAAAPAGGPVERRSSEEPEEGLVPIPSPMLGIFYRCPSPGAPAYVEVGSMVGEDDTVGLIEVMKVFNAVKAGLRGRVERVCAESGQFIEYGQPLFFVRPLS